MRISVATHDDVGEIERFCARLHPLNPGLACFPYVPDKLTRQLHAAIDDERGCYCVFLARNAAGEVAGLFFGNIEQPFFSHALVAQNILFVVRPDHRGSSAAVRLLRAFANWARKREATAICVNQNSAVEVARFGRFMRKLGFSLTGTNYMFQLR